MHTLQRTATRCSTLQHAAARYSTLHHAVAYYNTLQQDDIEVHNDTLLHDSRASRGQ